mgnify:CR=1 FL=1
MSQILVRHTFDESVPLDEVRATLRQALLALESPHGEDRVRLEVNYVFDAPQRTCVIDAGTAVGRDLSCLFAGFVCREFGAGAFHVERSNSAASPFAA